MAFKMKGNPIKLGGMATKAVAKMKEPMKMKSPMELKEKSPAELEEKSAMKMGHKSPADMKSPMEKDAIGPKGSATIPAHIREVYPNLTNEAYNKDKSFYDKAAQAVIKSKKSPATMKSPAELEKKSAMDMKSPMEAAKPDFPDIDGDGNTTESMKQAAADKKAGGPKMKSPMEAGHEDSPMEAGHEDSPMEAGHEDTPTKKIKYFGQRTSGSEVSEVMNHNKKYHTDPKREGNKLSNEVVKPGHPDH
jgi:hypothetical protein